MGALHAGHLSLLAAARAECSTVVMSLFVNPAQFAEPSDLNGYPRDEERDLAAATDAGVDLVFAPTVEEMYPPGFQTWVDVTELGADPRGRAPAGPLPRRRDRVSQALHDRSSRRRLLRAEGRPAGRRAPAPDRRSGARARSARPTDREGRGRPRALVPQRAPLGRPSASAPWRCRGRSRRATPTARARCSTGSRSTTSRSRRSTLPFSPPPSASALPA